MAGVLVHRSEWVTKCVHRPKNAPLRAGHFGRRADLVTGGARAASASASRLIQKAHSTDFPVHSVQGPSRGGW
jgi:hypothetical protein